jgi:hypothetical protein
MIMSSKAIEQFVGKCEAATSESHMVTVEKLAGVWFARVVSRSVPHDPVTLEHDWCQLAESVGTSIEAALGNLEVLLAWDIKVSHKGE